MASQRLIKTSAFGLTKIFFKKNIPDCAKEKYVVFFLVSLLLLFTFL